MSLGMGMGMGLGLGVTAYDGMGGHAMAMLPASRETSLSLNHLMAQGASDELYAYNAHLLDR
jgi:hypothetical protein